MAAPPEIARENGKKGGRPKAAHTIQAEAAKKQLIEDYLKNIKPINAALIAKAKKGDIQAIKELHDRVYGRAHQSMALSDPDGSPLFSSLKEMSDRELAAIAAGGEGRTRATRTRAA